MTAQPPIADPSAGLFGGRYELLALRGRGLSGEVWKARDTTTGRIVALKVLDATQTTQDAAWQEATLLTSLESPRLVRVHGAALAVDVPYLDMELATGGTVAKKITPHGVPAHVAVSWTRQAAQGVHLCHQRGLLHRDIKPDNLFLDGNGDVRLGDFGAAAVRAANGSTTVGGDPQIRAPEVLKGGGCTVASEVYSLGVTLHAMLVGHLPFRWADYGGFADFKAAAVAGPPDIRDVCPQVDLRLAKIIRTATSLVPAERYASVAEMDEALSRLPGGGSRSVAEVVPHPRSDRCWDAVPIGSSAATTVHVCVEPDGRAFMVRTAHVPSDLRILAGCGKVSPSQLPTFLRKVFADLR